MITDKSLLRDKSEIQESILQLEMSLSQKQQEVSEIQTQLVKYTGALGYIMDNLKPKEGAKCSEET